VQTEILKVTGMHCGGCTGKVTRALKAVAGVAEVIVSLTPGEAAVQYDEKLASPGKLKTAVETAGYLTAVADALDAWFVQLQGKVKTKAIFADPVAALPVAGSPSRA
jgi:copper chaperone